MKHLTPEHIESVIVKETYHVPDTDSESTLTVCVLTLKNGFEVTGVSACCSRDLYEEDKGMELARLEASGKIWQLEGYLLKERMFLETSHDGE